MSRRRPQLGCRFAQKTPPIQTISRIATTIGVKIAVSTLLDIASTPAARPCPRTVPFQPLSAVLCQVTLALEPLPPGHGRALAIPARPAASPAGAAHR